MTTAWLSLKKSLRCGSDPREVHEPERIHMNNLTASIAGGRRSNCSKSVMKQFKNVFSSRQMGSGSPQSIASNEFTNSMSHEAMMLRDSMTETNAAGLQENKGSAISGTLKSPVFPGPGMQAPATQLPHPVPLCRKLANPLFHDSAAELMNDTIRSYRINKHFPNFEALQSHPISNHAVKEVMEGDYTRNIVEIIFQTSWLKSGVPCGKIERILKVNNMQNTIARFEEYREMVKNNASKLPKKHARCLADGNEVLRFHGTTMMCSLGINGSSKLCNFVGCNVCQIIRTGFPTKEVKGRGIYTTATSGRAHDSITLCEDGLNAFPVKRAMFVCRVIAGRVHKPMQNVEAFSVPLGFDSVAGDVGSYPNLEELFVFNPRAVLPCFLVIYSETHTGNMLSRLTSTTGA